MEQTDRQTDRHTSDRFTALADDAPARAGVTVGRQTRLVSGERRRPANDRLIRPSESPAPVRRV